MSIAAVAAAAAAVAATPSTRRLRSSPRSAPATGPTPPQPSSASAGVVSESSFVQGKRTHEALPYGKRVEPIGTRLEVDFTDFLYIGTVLRHEHGGMVARFDADGEEVTLKPHRHRFRVVSRAQSIEPMPRKRQRDDAPSPAEETEETTSSSAPLASDTPPATPSVVEWAQCDDPTCGRWHELPAHVRASDLPRRFVCAMNNWDAAKPSCVKGGSARRESLAAASANGPTDEHQFTTGDLVDVDRRYVKDGGVGKISANDEAGKLFTIKYLMGGTEKKVPRHALHLIEAAVKPEQTKRDEMDVDNAAAPVATPTTCAAAATIAAAKTSMAKVMDVDDAAAAAAAAAPQSSESTKGAPSAAAAAPQTLAVPVASTANCTHPVASTKGVIECATKPLQAVPADAPNASQSTSKSKPTKKAPPGTSSGMMQANRNSTGPAYVPLPGFVCSNAEFYAALENETVGQVAEKLGCEWKELARLKNNTERYGKLLHGSKLRAGTLLKIPKVYSKWRVRKLFEQEEEDEICIVCEQHEHPADSPIVLCDGCDSAVHLACSGLQSVPEGDYFCAECLGILRSRKEKYGANGSLQAVLPPLPTLVASTHHNKALQSLLANRKAGAMAALLESHQAVRLASLAREKELSERAIPDASQQYEAAKRREKQAFNVVSSDYGIQGWGGKASEVRASSGGYYNHHRVMDPKYSSRWIHVTGYWGNELVLYEKHEVSVVYVRQPNTYYNSWNQGTPTRVESEDWQDANGRVNQLKVDARYASAVRERKNARAALAAFQEELANLPAERASRPQQEAEEIHALNKEYASLLDEPRKPTESIVDHSKRPAAPKLLGELTLPHDFDVAKMQMLCEPEELVIFLPLQPNDGPQADIATQIEPVSGMAILKSGGAYAVFARPEFFCRDRDDETPVNSPTRDALRTLMSLLLANSKNKQVIVSRPRIPSSVRVRADAVVGTDCFDLSALVRDCNVPMDLPTEPTPARMAENGLQLRDYQQASLRWMLDKECEPVGLGSMGEIWWRLRFLGSDVDSEYFYCELTGSVALDIFDFRSDVGQKNAANCFGGFPTGGILGEEMGLGKTMICLALIVRNPVPSANAVLPRENIWLAEKHVVQHPEYTPPPDLTGASGASNAKMTLSNGTLVVAPATLIAQWQNEVERYAPWLSVLTLHESENVKQHTVTSADIVIVSTFLLQQGGSAANKQQGASKAKRSKRAAVLGLVRRTHWHRILVDESHYNQSGESSRTKLVLATLSATHRHCVTGTPIGHSLDDLQGQLRFLRVAPFNRLSWWQNNIGNPYYSRCPDALKVLRNLLSRFVVRHSKEQQTLTGEALIALPPRSVETLLLPFGTDAEKDVYDWLEARNRTRFEELRRQSPATIAGKYIELVGMLVSTRQACSHIGMINLTKLDRTNRAIERSRMDRERTTYGGCGGAGGATAAAPALASNGASRATILQSAVARARPSASSRMRSVILKFQGGDLMECPICLEPVSEVEIAVTPCGHPFCSECLMNVLGAATSTREATGDCPSCRDKITRTEIVFLGEAEDIGRSSSSSASAAIVDQETTSVTTVNGFQSTTKQVQAAASGAGKRRKAEQARADRALLPTLTAEFLRNYDKCERTCGTKVARLLEEVDAMVAADPDSKCVAFSQFMGVLDVAAEQLQARGIRFVRVDGTVQQHARADALLDFSSDKEIKVFLLSMRAGAVGLTLTAADHCFILDTHQNAAVEEQAIDRIHRIGQLRPVTVKRFVMQATVEERIIRVRRQLGVDHAAAAAAAAVADASLMEQDTATRNPKKRRSGGGALAAESNGSDTSVANTNEDDRRMQRVRDLAEIFGCKLFASKV